MSYIGLIGVSNLGPENRFDFDKAEHMVKEGFDPTVTKIQTGWEQGIDGFWRYEIQDPFMESDVIEDYVKPRFGEPINIRMILKDALILKAYPQLENLTLYALYSPRRGTAGYYNPATGGWSCPWAPRRTSLTIGLRECCFTKSSILFRKSRALPKAAIPRR